MNSRFFLLRPWLVRYLSDERDAMRLYLAIDGDLLQNRDNAEGCLGLYCSPVIGNDALEVGARNSEDRTGGSSRAVDAKVVNLESRVLAGSHLVEDGSLGRVEESVDHVGIVFVVKLSWLWREFWLLMLCRCSC